jgi:hypothetical protein
MSALTEPLDDAQITLLKVMAEPYLTSRQWLFWLYVERMMDHLEYDDAEAVLKSLPIVGSASSIGPSYGLSWHDRVQLADDSHRALRGRWSSQESQYGSYVSTARLFRTR